MTSQKQIIANRRNALKSTGPVTARGKAIVAKNALKHGILSREVVLEEAGESRTDFKTLKRRLVKDLKPVGILEEMLVDKIAITYWRLRRVILAEKGEIRKRTDNLWIKEEVRKARQAEKYRQFAPLYSFFDKLLNSISAKEVKEKLNELKQTIKELGYLPDRAFQDYAKLRGLLFDKDNFALVHFFNQIAKGKIEEEPDKKKGEKGLLFVLNKDIKKAEIFLEVAREMEEKAIEAKELALKIPSKKAIDKLIRYETALENQLYKAINQLIKLQTLRKGGKFVSFKGIEIEGIES